MGENIMNTELKPVSLLKVFVSLAVVCIIADGTARGAPPDLLVGNPSRLLRNSLGICP